MLVRVKQAVRFYKVYIIEIEGEGILYSRRGNYKIMNKYNWTSRIYNNTRQVKYRSLGVSKEAEL